MTESLRGRFVWNELMTTNPVAAAGFYGKVVGWTVQPWAHDPAYSTFMAASGPAAGLMLQPLDAKAAGAPPSWMTYVGTPNVDGTARQAERLGGHVLRGVTATPRVGRWAILSDPQGAVFAAFTPESTRRDIHVPSPGEFSWHELATVDHRAALGFYQELFGWQEMAVHDMGPAGEYRLFGFPGEPPCGGMWDKPREMPAPPHWLCYVRVDDVKGAAGRIEAAGGRLVNGPTEVPGGDWIAQAVDPQGAAFALHQVAAAAPARATARKPAARKAAGKKPAARRPAPRKDVRRPPPPKVAVSRKKKATPARKAKAGTRGARAPASGRKSSAPRRRKRR